MRKSLTIGLIVLLGLFSCTRLSAQKKDGDSSYTGRGIERWTFKTNAVEWFATIPNFGVEFDLTPTSGQLMTIGLSASCNWNTYHSFKPALVFNVWEIRAEYRYYWRTKDKSPSGSWFREGMSRKAVRDSTRRDDRIAEKRKIESAPWWKEGMSMKQAKDSLRHYEKQAEEKMIRDYADGQVTYLSLTSPLRAFSDEYFPLERYRARVMRANYVGAYANAGAYSVKLGKYGHQGQMYGFGITSGYALPMYEYKMGAVDIELGLSLGLAIITDDVYTHNPNGNYYTRIAEKSRGLHVAPFPVLSEISVAFAWRPYRKPKAITAKVSDSFNEKYREHRKDRRTEMDKRYQKRQLDKYARQQARDAAVRDKKERKEKAKENENQQ